MQFNTKIKTAHFQQNSDSWLLTDTTGQSYSSRYVITAMGILNERTLPNIPGIADFEGDSWHTARWPSEGINALAGKRVAIIGTGATAIQTIQTIAPTVGHLTVFQRTPNWTAPLRNAKISKEEMQKIRKRYPEIFRQCLKSYSCFIHVADSSVDVFALPEEERIALWEKLYAQPGFSKVLAISPEIYTDKTANEMYSKFHAAKVRARVHDPVIAEKLIPTNHGFGTRRVPLESGYYEVFNQPNVKLVDIKENPIERISEKGIKTSEAEFEFDIIIYATGFDAVTGSFDAVDFQGVNGTKLKNVWGDGIRTFLGFTVR
jgi:cation diffusion facilitator CzcD-associated flavoprotein CzcO